MRRSCRVLLLLPLLACDHDKSVIVNSNDTQDTETAPDPLQDRPLPAVVAITLTSDEGTGATNIADFVKARVKAVSEGSLPPTTVFPLAADHSDDVRVIDGLSANVLARWMDPLSSDRSAAGEYFGANPDFTAWFGDDWDSDVINTPWWTGSATSGWLWVSHEHVSGTMPALETAATGQFLSFALWLQANGVLTNDVSAATWTQEDIDTYVKWYKTTLGGSWIRINQGEDGLWSVDTTAANLRYDATSDTRLLMTGHVLLSGDTHDDDGAALPAGVTVGTVSDCAGGITPWGTVLLGEENTHDAYGEAEPCWTNGVLFISGKGCDPGEEISMMTDSASWSEFGRSSDENAHQSRDAYGYLAEIDPGQPPTEYLGATTRGVGHDKIGALGRGRWENGALALNDEWKLEDGKPIVLYGGQDRNGGRVYKLVSLGNYVEGMTRADIRDLLSEGKLYVAHLAGLDNTNGLTLTATGNLPTASSPGSGQWIELSLSSTSKAPNGAALGLDGVKVGNALASLTYNQLGGFPDYDTVLTALYTASNKVGIMETNRPEEVEWNPKDPSGTPRLYVAFTGNRGRVALDQDGVMYDPTTAEVDAPVRSDKTGAIFVFQEADPSNPGTSDTFKYWAAWVGSIGTTDGNATGPDNLLVDADGGVWFTTDGNYGVNGHSDALYYLDLDPDHKTTDVPTFGWAFRVAAMPSDAEATGPSFTSDMTTLFISAQHPGQFEESTWPW